VALLCQYSIVRSVCQLKLAEVVLIELAFHDGIRCSLDISDNTKQYLLSIKPSRILPNFQGKFGVCHCIHEGIVEKNE